MSSAQNIDPSDVVIVLTTAPKTDDAERIARGLVEARHAACVNLIPGIRSFYRWQGAIEDEQDDPGLYRAAQDLAR